MTQEVSLENKIAARALVEKGRLEVGRHISKKRARELIELGLAGPGQIDPFPKVIEPTPSAVILSAPTNKAN